MSLSVGGRKQRGMAGSGSGIYHLFLQLLDEILPLTAGRKFQQ